MKQTNILRVSLDKINELLDLPKGFKIVTNEPKWVKWVTLHIEIDKNVKLDLGDIEGGMSLDDLGKYR